MKVAVFLTYNYSLQTWYNSGTLKRELEIYNQINILNNAKFTFYTYGGSEDLELIRDFPNFNVVPMFKNSQQKVRFIDFYIHCLFLFYLKRI